MLKISKSSSFTYTPSNGEKKPKKLATIEASFTHFPFEESLITLTKSVLHVILPQRELTEHLKLLLCTWFSVAPNSEMNLDVQSEVMNLNISCYITLLLQ